LRVVGRHTLSKAEEEVLLITTTTTKPMDLHLNTEKGKEIEKKEKEEKGKEDYYFCVRLFVCLSVCLFSCWGHTLAKQLIVTTP